MDPAVMAAAGITPGSYVVNADGTLTPTDPGQGGRRTADAPGRLER